MSVLWYDSLHVENEVSQVISKAHFQLQSINYLTDLGDYFSYVYETWR